MRSRHFTIETQGRTNQEAANEIPRRVLNLLILLVRLGASCCQAILSHYSMIEPQVRLAMVPVIALAQSEAMKTAALATSSRVGSRPRTVPFSM